MSLNFSPARGEDFGFIAAAQLETAALSYGRPWSVEEQADLSLRIARSLQASSSRVMMLREGGIPLGYFWLEMRNSQMAFLLDIYVVLERRQQGLGAALLNEAARQAGEMGAKELRLAVAARNEKAIQFFARKGLASRDREVREHAVWFELAKSLI